jgi:hypothetical protein
MHRAFLLILPASLFLFDAPASSQVAFVQAVANVSSGSTSSFSLSFPSNTAAGNLILVGFDCTSSGSTFSSVTDSQGNVLTEVGGPLTTPGGVSTRLYYANNIGGGADAVTITFSANVRLEVYLTEYSGVNQVTPIDAQSGAVGNAGAVSSGNATTTASGDMIYGFCIGDSTCTAGSGSTARSTFHNNLIEDKISGNPGAYAATGSADSGWTMQMVALKAAASSATVSSGPLNACDLATPYGTIDAHDVQAAVNMTLGSSPCTANIIGLDVCNVVVVQRVINAALPGGTCNMGSVHQVSLTWVASAIPNVTYNVYRSNTSGSYSSSPVASLISGTSYIDNTVLSGQTYFYVVTAASGGVESNHSNEVQAVIPTP